MNSPKCPGCKSDEVACLGRRNAFYPAGCLALGGVVIAIIHQATAPVDFKCEACGKRFGVRSVGAKLCLFAIILAVLWLLGAMFLMD